MGYDLRITRRSGWSTDGGPEITLDEWKAYVETDADIRPAPNNGPADFLCTAHPAEPSPLWWDHGEVITKNPDKDMICKMAAIARHLDAKVQGDDGEIYREDGTSYEPEVPTPPSQPGFLARVVSWFQHRREVREQQNAAPAFKTGQRVKNPWGMMGTVLSADPGANGGLGRVHVRLDDGREQAVACVASGLEVVEDASTGG